MGELTDQDPWYSNRGHGEAKFDPDGTVTFSWPFVDGVEMNPFSQMGMTNPLTLRWELEHDGAVIRILFGAQRGPQEIVCRHPVHGGWILYSMGSVWTSWEMPPCGPDGRSTDAFLWDDELHNLPSAIKLSGLMEIEQLEMKKKPRRIKMPFRLPFLLPPHRRPHPFCLRPSFSRSTLPVSAKTGGVDPSETSTVALDGFPLPFFCKDFRHLALLKLEAIQWHPVASSFFQGLSRS